MSDLAYYQRLPYEVRGRRMMLRIMEWYEYWQGNVYVAFSGGKDSTVLLHAVRSLFPDVPAVFCDTGLEYPEVREFVKTVDNVEWIKPKKTFRQIIQEYGYPAISKEQSQFIWEYRNTRSEKLQSIRLFGNKYGRGKISNKWLPIVDSDIKVSHKCCDIMKKNPSKAYEKATGRKPFIGTMAMESALRKSEWKRHGCNAFDIKRPVSKPLSVMSDGDIWKYIHENKVPYSKIYDMGYKRTGCMFCMFGAHCRNDNRFKLMEVTHPKIHNYCMHELGCKHVLDVVNKCNAG